MPTVRAWDERWPIAGDFTTAHGAKAEAHLVLVEIVDGGFAGRGECTPYPRYGETPSGVLGEIDAIRPALEDGADRQALQHLLGPGAARNALDCAFWDLQAKRTGTPAWRLAGLAGMQPVKTAYTISLAPPEVMATRAGRG